MHVVELVALTLAVIMWPVPTVIYYRLCLHAFRYVPQPKRPRTAAAAQGPAATVQVSGEVCGAGFPYALFLTLGLAVGEVLSNQCQM